jgi:hypothetical protein
VLSLPVDLIRLATECGEEVGPLGLLPGVIVYRRRAAPAPERADYPGWELRRVPRGV